MLAPHRYSEAVITPEGVPSRAVVQLYRTSIHQVMALVDSIKAMLACSTSKAADTMLARCKLLMRLAPAVTTINPVPSVSYGVGGGSTAVIPPRPQL